MNPVHTAIRLGTTAGVLAVVAAGIGGTALGASAADVPPTTPATNQAALTRIHTAANTQIARRLTALDAAISTVSASQVITTDDKATLTGILTNDVTGLSALRQTIDADTTAQQASTDERTIFTTYRVYALALPQVRYAAAGDAIAAAVVPALTKAHDTLANLLAADRAKNTTAVQASMSDLAAQIMIATTKTTGLSATVLGFIPLQYNANHGLLAPSRQALAAARAAIATADADIASVQAALV